MCLRSLLILIIFVASNSQAYCSEIDDLVSDLKNYYASIQDSSDSTNKILRVFSLLEMVPSAGQITSLYVPSANTKGKEPGPSRIIVFPPSFYSLSLADVLRKQLSFRNSNPATAYQRCSGLSDTFTDCCVQSPYLSCVEDERTISPETTLPQLREPLYALTAMDLIAVEFSSHISSFSLAELKSKKLTSNTLYLLIGPDTERDGNFLLASLDVDTLSKLTIAVSKLEQQMARRKAEAPKLTGSIACTTEKWKVVDASNGLTLPVEWLAGNSPILFRGSDKGTFAWIGLGGQESELIVTSREATVPATQDSLYSFYSDPKRKIALMKCFGTKIITELDEAKPLLNILKSPDVSAFFSIWLHLVGTLTILTEIN